jgi:hypothetical protein
MDPWTEVHVYDRSVAPPRKPGGFRQRYGRPRAGDQIAAWLRHASRVDSYRDNILDLHPVAQRPPIIDVDFSPRTNLVI